jgi:hypothetical protein
MTERHEDQETPNDLPEGGSANLPIPPRRSHLKKAFLILALLAVACIATFGIYNYIENVRLGDPIAAAKKAGIPLTYSDPFFAKWGAARPTSPEENAAVSYEEAFAILETIPPPDAKTSLVPILTNARLPDDPREPLSPETIQALRQYLEPLGEAFDLLHKGARAPGCYFSIKWEGANTLLPHLTRVRQAARQLALKACLAAEEGRSYEAAQAICDSLALSRGLYEEPELISGLVGCAVASISLWAADRLLSRAEVSSDDLLTLQTALSDAADRVSFHAGFAGEIAMQQDSFDRIQKGEDPLDIIGGGASPSQRNAVRKTLFWLMRGSGYVQANRKKCLRETLKLVEIAGDPTPETLNDAFWRDWTVRVSSRRHILASMFLNALGKSIAQGEKARARLRASAACCAAMRYRNDTGKWPDSLDTLVPAYLDKLPIDPFTGNPLIYAVGEYGIMVYSVGSDQTDDGGRPGVSVSAAAETPPATIGDDVGFRVWKTAEQPPGQGDTK